MTRRSVILGTGGYLPEKVLTNKEFEAKLETTDEWIRTRTGIRKRHIAAPGELTSQLATCAAEAAIANAGIDRNQIDLIIVATTTPDQTFPATAVKVQAALGIKPCPAYDVQAVCAGFVFAMATADSLLKTGLAKTALVIGADTLSRIVDWNDRGTCILFGDGAGAIIMQATENSERGVLASRLCTDGNTADLLYVDGGVSSNQKAGFIHMQGKEVFKHAVHCMSDVTRTALADAGLKDTDINWAVPHQANQRILDATVEKLGLPKEKLISTVGDHANTSAASIPLALSVAARDGRIKKGDIVAIQAIGGGLSWGASIIRW